MNFWGSVWNVINSSSILFFQSCLYMNKKSCAASGGYHNALLNTYSLKNGCTEKAV